MAPWSQAAARMDEAARTPWSKHRTQTSYVYEKRVTTKVAADALGVKSGRVLYFTSVVGTTKSMSPQKRGPDPRSCPPAAKGYSCYRPRRTGDRKHKSSVYGCVVDANLSVLLSLVIVEKRKKERYSWSY